MLELSYKTKKINIMSENQNKPTKITTFKAAATKVLEAVRAAKKALLNPSNSRKRKAEAMEVSIAPAAKRTKPLERPSRGSGIPM
jgi:hypothetical protein